MKFPFFASFIIFILVLQHNINKGKKIREREEDNFWKRESSANDVRKQSLDDLEYITFSAEPFFPVSLMDPDLCSGFLERNPDVKDILSRLLDLENKKIVNLTAYSNTDLKFKYGVANLEILTEYDTNYNELITQLQHYGAALFKENLNDQALAVLEYAVSIGSDISSTYMTCAEIYHLDQRSDKLCHLKEMAEKIPTSRKNTIVRKLQEFDLYND